MEPGHPTRPSCPSTPGAVFAELPSPSGGDAIVLSQYCDETQLAAIMALVAKDLSEPYSVFTYRAFLQGWPQYALLAHVGARLVGVIVCKEDMRPRTMRMRGYVAMLAIEADCRRAGLGRALAVEAMRRMAISCDEVVLEAEVTNTPALRLYESLGFLRDKRLGRYYLLGSDAFRLKLSITPWQPKWAVPV